MWIFASAILTNYLITKCSSLICTVAQHCCIPVMFQLVPINTCAYCIVGSPGNECQHFAADEKSVDVCVVYVGGFFFVQCKTWSLNLLLSPWQLEWCCLCLDSVSWTHRGKKDERKCLKKKKYLSLPWLHAHMCFSEWSSHCNPKKVIYRGTLQVTVTV